MNDEPRSGPAPADPPPPAPPAPPPGVPVGPPPAPSPAPGTWAGAGVAPAATGWDAATAAPRSRRRWAIGCFVIAVVLIVGVAGCTAFLVRSFGSAGEVVLASDGRVDQFNVSSFNGTTEVTFWAARGVDAAEGPVIACEVIVPTLAGTELARARWVLRNRAGDVIASSETPC